MKTYRGKDSVYRFPLKIMWNFCGCLSECEMYCWNNKMKRSFEPHVTMKNILFLICIINIGRKEDVNMLIVYDKKTCITVEMWRDAFQSRRTEAMFSNVSLLCIAFCCEKVLYCWLLPSSLKNFLLSCCHFVHCCIKYEAEDEDMMFFLTFSHRFY